MIHVVCDNARFHRPDQCKKVKAYLGEWRHRARLRFLPAYAPQANPIERVWRHLHEEATRNHRCGNIEQLLDMVSGWVGRRSRFEIESSIYGFPLAA